MILQFTKILITGALSTWASTHAAASVLHVDAAAAPGGDGLSWSSALVHLCDALGHASSPGSGITEIRVAQGVHRPDRSMASPLGTKDRNAGFRLVDGVALRGGYAGLSGNAERPDERDIDRFITVLSGDLAGNDGPVGSFAGTEENAYQVVVAVNVDRDAILEGFVVRGGRADGVSLGPTPDSRDQGSAVNIYFGGPRIERCIFEQNWSVNHGTINDHGHNSVVAHCVFRHNFSAQFGSGLYVHDHSATLATNCLFENNTATTDGAGGYCRSETGAIFMDCTFRGNTAKRGAGMYCDPDSMPMVSGCIFEDNRAEHGGGIYNDANAVTVSECTFDGNTSEIGGAGLYNHFNQATVVDCSFSKNVAAYDDPGGGGGSGGSGGAGVWNAGGVQSVVRCRFDANMASFGAGVYSNEGSEATVSHCTFTDNLAKEGAGVYSLAANSHMTDCVFSGNAVSGSIFSVGGGASAYFADVTFDRCLFTRNSAEFGGGGIYTEGSNPVIRNCRFHGNRAWGALEGWGGGILNAFAANPSLANCEFVGNVAHRGGGIHNTAFTNTRIVNCTFSANQAMDAPSGNGLGGGLFNSTNTETLLANAIFWANTPSQIEGLEPAVTYSCIQDGLPGRGNLSVDPVFLVMPVPGPDGIWGTTDDQYGNTGLRHISPCVDAGNNLTVPEGLDDDVGGAPRFVDVPTAPDTGLPDSLHALIDMGAHEVQWPGCPADVTGNGTVDVSDLLAVINQWGRRGLVPADITGDGSVGVDDLLAVINSWGSCPA